MIEESRLYVVLGEIIRSRRLLAEFTQAQLAEQVGLERTSITNIEKGVQKVPLHVLFRICGALDVSATKLLESLNVDESAERRESEIDGATIKAQLSSAGSPLLGSAIERVLTPS
ncbi:helix-turn-helix domain-containing protein [Acidovorax radicis]|uniref:helix-turn-helix domain-containing protein n=1 Tax=Acidovorax radicis TaxID=758826 RepID=UPI001CF84D73|nr:helix-turn-helix transcriptional regulator [Acidovorax radicis]UCU99246.1 helix-turn-helix transcriptional regulator [Acidovorax radicis]